MEQLLTFVRESVPVWLIIFAGFALAFGLTFQAIPTIVNVSRMKNLCAAPNTRTSHSSAIPNLGGVAIFIGFIISTILAGGNYFTSDLFYVIAAMVIIFFIGMKDDILVIDPKKKFAAQIIVAAIIAIFADIRFVHFFGIFNIGNISYIASVTVTVFLFIVIINGFNLIDGIDGLAAGTGVIASLVFGVWFHRVNNIEYSIMCFCLAGSLIAFFIHNVFGRRNKIFLGDTGSMLIGVAVSVIIVQFLRINMIEPKPLIHSAPAYVVSVLILPLFDTLRVFTIRISQGRSPFKADKQHIHHRLLELGFTHLQSTVMLMSVNLLFIAFSYIFQNMNNLPQMFIQVAMASLLSYTVTKFARNRTKRLSEMEYYTTGNIETAKLNNSIFIKAQKNIGVADAENVNIAKN